jgi:small neutral amino acid transporter SnatA (MarC family)
MVIVLQILGAVLGVLQVALAVEMMVHGLQELGVLPA